MNLGGTVHINKTGCCLLLGAIIVFLYYMFSTSITSKNAQTIVNFDQVDLRELLLVAIEASRDGGKEVVATRNDLKIESKGKTKEGANDSVTTADFKSHCVMMKRLKRSFPHLKIVSEEAKTVCEDQDPYSNFNNSKFQELNLNNEWVDSKDVTVWIDPLDATQEYTERLYEYVTTMVCVAVRGKPLIGVIHKPFTKETTWAWIGRGRSKNLIVSQEHEKNKIKCIVSRSHTGKVKEIIEKSFKGQNVETISAGGAGYKVLEVAKGNADVYVHVTAIKKWDVCAGNAILNSLGGEMTTRSHTEINYADSDNVVNEDGIVATLRNHNGYLNNL